MVGERPRFFFNATSLSTGGPFVLTQRIINLPSDRVEPYSVRLDLGIESHPRFEAPLGPALTLEQLNSSPAQFPLASAAMASAAFPIGLEPMPLRLYGYVRSEKRVYPTVGRYFVSDGGVWDNSGLSTLSQLYGHIRRNRKLNGSKKPPRLILISVSAETEAYNPSDAREKAEEEGYLDKLVSALGLPLRIGHIYSNLNLIHFTNKRRAEEMAVDNLRDILEPTTVQDDQRQLAYYFPIALTQLSGFDAHKVPDREKLFERVQKIATNYTISHADDTKLAEAANALVSTPQGEGKGWKVGPTCGDGTDMIEVQRLDEGGRIRYFSKQSKPMALRWIGPPDLRLAQPTTGALVPRLLTAVPTERLGTQHFEPSNSPNNRRTNHANHHPTPLKAPQVRPPEHPDDRAPPEALHVQIGLADPGASEHSRSGRATVTVAESHSRSLRRRLRRRSPCPCRGTGDECGDRARSPGPARLQLRG